MKRKRFRTRLGSLIALAFLICITTGFAVGKYIQTVRVSGTVTFSAKLASRLILSEHKAERQSNGTYTLSATEYISNDTQSYVLIPGLDVPKDPHVVIEGKSSIPAYLFIEVVDHTPNTGIQYTMESCWQETSKTAPRHGGVVYIYCTADENGETEPAKITTDQDIYILKDNKIYVSQTLLSSTTNDLITIYAYLEETTD